MNRQLAPHVQAAIQAAAGGSARAGTAGSAASGPPIQPRAAGVAPHVQAAIQTARAQSAHQPSAGAGSIQKRPTTIPRRSADHVYRAIQAARARAVTRGAIAQPMRSQFLSEGKAVDLNCGRYCSAEAIKIFAGQHGLDNIPADAFHDVLSDPTPKLLGFLKIGWSPGREGAALFEAMAKPATIQEWELAVQTYGSLVVSGKLGLADWGVVGGVGHFILIVGVDVANNQLLYLDPLKGDSGQQTYDFDRAQERIKTVHHVRPDAMLDLNG